MRTGAAGHRPDGRRRAGHAGAGVLPEAQIDDAATAAGRDPATIRRIYNMFGSIRERGSGGFLQGTVAQWTDELTMVAVEHGVDTFVFGPADDPIRQTQVFAAEVAPAVRDAVARERHASGTT